MRTAVTLVIISIVLNGCYFMETDDLEPDYFVLGILDEYMGYRFTEESDRVAHFYWGEEKVAAVFIERLEEFADLLDEENDIVAELPPEGAYGSIDVHSKALQKEIIAMYSEIECSGAAMDGQEICAALITPDVLEEGGREGKKAYLAGAYTRYCRGNKFILANATHKAIVIRDLLIEFSCTDVQYDLVSGFPCSNTITFQPSPEMQDLFSQLDEALESAELDYSSYGGDGQPVPGQPLATQETTTSHAPAAQ